jgi:hypothetical protein
MCAAPVLDDSLDTIIIVDGLPRVPADKVDKLSSVVAAHLLLFNVKDITMPLNEETQKTQGFAFVQLASADDAKRAEKEVTGVSFDDKRKYTVNRMADFDKIMATPETFTPPPAIDLESWVRNPDCFDQFVVRHGDMTSVYWNKRKVGACGVFWGVFFLYVFIHSYARLFAHSFTRGAEPRVGVGEGQVVGPPGRVLTARVVPHDLPRPGSRPVGRRGARAHEQVRLGRRHAGRVQPLRAVSDACSALLLCLVVVGVFCRCKWWFFGACGVFFFFFQPLPLVVVTSWRGRPSSRTT